MKQAKGTTIEAVRAALARYERRPFKRDGLRPAAVLLPLYEREGELFLLLTLRSQEVAHHKGQISFPGGAFDPQDGDLERTVLRECREETGLRPEDVRIVGMLDDCPTISDFTVTPFVGFIPHPYPFTLCAAEVAQLIEAPLAELLRPEIFREDRLTWRGETHPVYFYDLGAHTIWGVTAHILKQFLERVFPRGLDSYAALYGRGRSKGKGSPLLYRQGEGLDPGDR